MTWLPTDSSKIRCLRCETDEGVTMQPSYTAYHWDGTGPNPNADLPLCKECGEEHYEYMMELWSHARGGY